MQQVEVYVHAKYVKKKHKELEITHAIIKKNPALYKGSWGNVVYLIKYVIRITTYPKIAR